VDSALDCETSAGMRKTFKKDKTYLEQSGQILWMEQDVTMRPPKKALKSFLYPISINFLSIYYNFNQDKSSFLEKKTATHTNTASSVYMWNAVQVM
jgi:hypothetical protein